MTLSEAERQAWEEIERSLQRQWSAGKDPVQLKNQRIPAVASAALRSAAQTPLLVVSIVILFIGVLMNVPLFVITGAVAMCITMTSLNRYIYEDLTGDPGRGARK